MEVARRIFDLRKSLGLNQESFGKRIGVTRSAVCNYENGSRSIGDQIILSICREFNVSETWLRTGKGEMFVPSPSGALDAFIGERKLSPFDRVLIDKFAALDAGSRQAVVNYVLAVADAIQPSVAPVRAEPDTAGQERTQTDLNGQERTQADTAGQEQVVVFQNAAATPPNLAAKVAELERQNQELAAEIAAMKEEDAIEAERLRSASAGSFDPALKAKK